MLVAFGEAPVFSVQQAALAFWASARYEPTAIGPNSASHLAPERRMTPRRERTKITARRIL